MWIPPCQGSEDRKNSACSVSLLAFNIDVSAAQQPCWSCQCWKIQADRFSAGIPWNRNGPGLHQKSDALQKLYAKLMRWCEPSKDQAGSLCAQSPVACVRLFHPSVTMCSSSHTWEKKASMLENKQTTQAWAYFQTGIRNNRNSPENGLLADLPGECF